MGGKHPVNEGLVKLFGDAEFSCMDFEKQLCETSCENKVFARLSRKVSRIGKDREKGRCI